MILEHIDSPKDLKTLSVAELETLAAEIRELIMQVVAQNGGHFAPNLGTVELTIALHTAFETPRDRLIWDIGHQAYPHKILTGRRERFPTLRQYHGISGFLKRDESEYDAFGGGHSSTSIAAALGMATARDLMGEDYKVIAVIGDGGMTGGLAYEALNSAGDMKKDLIVVLNDNNMSISPTVGAMSKHFNKIATNPTYNMIRKGTQELMERFSPNAMSLARRLGSLLGEGTLFEELGFRYLGPLDGHDLEALIEVFQGVCLLNEPVLVHVVTCKGKGYEPAVKDSQKLYSLSPGFDLTTATYPVQKPRPPRYTDVFSETLIKLGHQDPNIVAITAAMPDGTGLKRFSEVFPDRFFDVGLAEQCAVTFAAGLAAEGLKPFAAIYSTFLQRSYDQIVHDVCLQKLPVRFALDRAGLVGADGPTHHGVFDYAFLRHIPNMVIMAPRDEAELCHMLKTASEYDGGAISVRYPRGRGVGVPLPAEPECLPIGKAELFREGEDVVVFAIGNRVHPAMEAASILESEGISAAVVNARFVKPLDEELILSLAKRVGRVVTVEDGVLVGGFGNAVVELIQDRGLGHISISRRGIPDEFAEHGESEQLYRLFGMDAAGIADACRGLCSAQASA